LVRWGAALDDPFLRQILFQPSPQPRISTAHRPPKRHYSLASPSFSLHGPLSVPSVHIRVASKFARRARMTVQATIRLLCKRMLLHVRPGASALTGQARGCPRFLTITRASHDVHQGSPGAGAPKSVHRSELQLFSFST